MAYRRRYTSRRSFSRSRYGRTRFGRTGARRRNRSRGGRWIFVKPRFSVRGRRY